MIENHSEFLAAVRQCRLVRIFFYTLPDGRTMDHRCVPIGFAADPKGPDTRERYWFLDPNFGTGQEPLGLVAEQIMSLDVLEQEFAPEDCPWLGHPCLPEVLQSAHGSLARIAA